jgi:hypothetical protein
MFPTDLEELASYRRLSSSVAKKTRPPARNLALVGKLLLQCRTNRPSARNDWQAVSLRQKLFAIGEVDGEDCLTVAV